MKCERQFYRFYIIPGTFIWTDWAECPGALNCQGRRYEKNREKNKKCLYQILNWYFQCASTFLRSLRTSNNSFGIPLWVTLQTFLENYWDILKSIGNGKVVEKFWWIFRKIPSFLKRALQTLWCNFKLIISCEEIL